MRAMKSRPAVIALVAAVVLIPPASVRAITFEEWATGQGWSAGHVMSVTVDARSASIDSLVGIGNYDWTTTPTANLFLSYNQITSIAPGTFMGLDNLTTLFIYGNQITSIESGDFDGLGHLTTLEMDHNRITSIEAGDFTGLGNLTSLRLDRNQIASVESGDFTGLGNLTSLNLGYNQIASIETDDFTGLGNLTSLRLDGNQITSVEVGDFTGLGNLTSLSLDSNRITSVETGDFIGLDNLMFLRLGDNLIASVDAGDFAGLENLTSLYLDRNRIAIIESGAFAGLKKLQTLSLESNTPLRNLNLEDADFSSLANFMLSETAQITHVSLKNTVLSQTALVAIVTGGAYSSDVGIGELRGVTELDLSGIDFAAITDLSPLYLMDNVTDLWLVNVLDLDANALDTLLDNLAAMEDADIEGTLYLTLADFEAFNAAGSGKLARWDAEPGHHVQIVPEPPAAVLLLTALAAFGALWHRQELVRPCPTEAAMSGHT